MPRSEIIMTRSEVLATMTTDGLRYERKARLLMTTDAYAVNDRLKEYQADYADRISDEIDRRNNTSDGCPHCLHSVGHHVQCPNF